MTCTASQAPLAANRPNGRWLSPTPSLRSRMGVLDLGVAAMVGLEGEHVAVPVGDEGVEVMEREERQLGTRRGPHPPHDEPHRGTAWPLAL